MNDIEQAVSELKSLLIAGISGLDLEMFGKVSETSFRLAILALEKQIPKKPIQSSWSIAKCPCCGAELGEWLEDGYHKDYTNLKICDCGQKLDWEE